MTLKELGTSSHVGRADHLIEFVRNRTTYHAICPRCGGLMRWENWRRLHEPLQAICRTCNLRKPSTELNLEPDDPDSE